jgi:hypothetical protein
MTLAKVSSKTKVNRKANETWDGKWDEPDMGCVG